MREHVYFCDLFICIRFSLFIIFILNVYMCYLRKWYRYLIWYLQLILFLSGFLYLVKYEYLYVLYVCAIVHKYSSYLSHCLFQLATVSRQAWFVYSFYFISSLLWLVLRDIGKWRKILRTYALSLQNTFSCINALAIVHEKC